MGEVELRKMRMEKEKKKDRDREEEAWKENTISFHNLPSLHPCTHMLYLNSIIEVSYSTTSLKT